MTKLNALLLCIFVLSIIGYYGIYQTWALNSKGRYTIARYVGTLAGGRQGASDLYEFYYKGIRYNKSIKVYNDKRYFTYKYCNFLPSNPSICKIEYDILVPNCVLPNKVPLDGWENMPNVKCSDTLSPLFSGRINLNSR